MGSIGGMVGSNYNNQSGSSRGSNQGSTSQYGESSWSPHPALNDLYGYMAGNLGQLAMTPTPYFQGQGYVGPSSSTQQGVNSLLGAANRQEGVLNTADQNYNFLSNAADVANNPYVQGMLGVNKQQANQALTENWLPAINSGAQSVNALGSGRQGIAQAQGIERASTQLNNANQQLMNTAYGQGLNAQQYALGQTGNLAAAHRMPGETRNQAGQIVEGYQQRALDDAMARYYHQYDEPWQRMGRAGEFADQFFGKMGKGYESGRGYQTGNTSERRNGSGWGLYDQVSGNAGIKK